jgi:hypothetical protein
MLTKAMLTKSMSLGARGQAALIIGVVTVLVVGCSNDEGTTTAALGTSTASTATATAAATTPTVTARATATPSSSRSPSSPSSGSPSSGSKSREKPSVAISRAPLVKVGQPANISDGVRITVGAVRDQKVSAELPGEIAGPAAVVPVTVRNSSNQPFSLDGVVVTAFYDDDVPATETTVDPAKPLTGSLAAGRTAKGVYVFTVPREQASTLRIEVSSNQSATIVQFAR